MKFLIYSCHNLCDTTEEQQIESHEEWPSLLAPHSREIIDSLNMEMLVPHLIQKGLLTRSEYCELDSSPSWKRSEHYVLKILPTKGEQGLRRFVECLKDESEHSGHQDLFKSLKSKLKH